MVEERVVADFDAMLGREAERGANRAAGKLMAADGSVGFLLGAGASHPLGYPLLGELTRQVQERLAPDLQAVYERLLATEVPVGREPTASVETVLAAADAAVQHRLPPPGFGLRDLALLGHEARKAIWSILADERGGSEDLAYLDPLSELVRGCGSVVVLSLNNDRVVERWCRRARMPLSDGFDRHGVFDAGRLRLRKGRVTLVKLHGSVDWERTSDGRVRRLGRLVHSPAGRRAFRSPLPELSLVFPSETKVVTEQPFFDLFRLLHDLLPRLSTLIVVGCGLHDGHVVSAIREALWRSRELRIVIVDPNPELALSALTPKGLRDVAGHRVDALALRVEEALDGPLQSRLGQGASAPALLRLVLLEGATKRAGKALALLDQEVSRTADGEGSSWGNLAALVDRPLGVGKMIGAWGEVYAALGHGVSSQPEADRLLDAVKRARAGPVARALDSWGDQLYAVAGDRLCRCNASGEPQAAIGPNIAGAADLVVAGDQAYLLQTRILNREGLGCLRRVDLNTGRAARLARDGRPLAVALLPHLARLLIGFYGRGEVRRLALKHRLDAAGLLRWPSALKRFDERRLLLLESRRPVLVDPRAREVSYPLRPLFINLGDATVVTRGEVILLEGGVVGHGRLWLWRVASGTVTVLLENVVWGAGVAWDADRRLILLAQGGELPGGKVVCIPMNSAGLLGRYYIVADKLHRPRRFFRTKDGAWLCCTGHGLIELRLGGGN